MTHAPTFPAWLGNAVDALVSGDVGGWMSIYAPDAVHEFPYAPTGGVQRLAGRDEIAAYLTSVVTEGPLRLGPLSNIRVRETGDETIIEFDGNHQRIADGAPILLSYVWFLTRRDGLVTNFRDYMNPVQLAQSADATAID